jgi:hypothetical protein
MSETFCAMSVENWFISASRRTTSARTFSGSRETSSAAWRTSK